MKVFKVVTEWEGRLWSWLLDHYNPERAGEQIAGGTAVEYIPGVPTTPKHGRGLLFATTNLHSAHWYADCDSAAQIWEAEAHVEYDWQENTVLCKSITLIKPHKEKHGASV